MLHPFEFFELGSILTKCFCTVLLAILCSSTVFAQSDIRVQRRLLSNGQLQDVTNDPAFVAINGNNVTITADDDATDWFIRQQDTAEAIGDIEFKAFPSGSALLKYRVSVGTLDAWNDDETEEQLPGCSSLNKFYGVGKAITTVVNEVKIHPYYVKVRIGVSDRMGFLETNEVVRVDADRIDSESGTEWTLYGRLRVVSAGKMHFRLLANRTRNANLPDEKYDPDLSVDWPYNADEDERIKRGDVDMLTTQEPIHISAETNGDIFLTHTHDPIPGSFHDVLARGIIAGKLECYRKAVRIEGWKGVNLTPLRAGLGGEFLMAGKFSGETALSAGNISGNYDYQYDSFQNANHVGEDDGKIKRVRAVTLADEGGRFTGTLRIKSLELTSNLENDLIRFDADMPGRVEFIEELPATKMMWVGLDMNAGDMGDAIIAPADGIKGQVIVNRNNDGEVWSGPVSVSGGALSPMPDYTQLSDAIGGGAVGEAPFQLHDEDCLPENTGGLTTPGKVLLWQSRYPDRAELYKHLYPLTVDEDGNIRTRLYGPVKTDSEDEDPAVTIERLDGSTWVNANSEFDITVTGDDVDTPLGRDVLVKPDLITVNDLICPAVYRIVPNNLKCKFVTGEPGVADFAHYFEIDPASQVSAADIGQQGGVPGADGMLDNNDFVVHIGYFFGNDPIADLGRQGGAFGPDTLFDNNDFVIFIALFFDPVYTAGDCSIDEPASAVPFELPDGLATGDSTTDRQLNALWMFLERTGDSRIAARLVDTLFGDAAR